MGTRINSINIYGFKSFANKTDITLDKGMNVVLGPNGSGKSNIMDAICFVLGRISAKSMRADKASNLIYNGGKRYSPMNRGSVSISFDNKNQVFPIDSDSLVISRTITSKGSSTYRINGKKHTRNEVLDMLSHANVDPNGFNIVLQGDIIRFVEMSPNERRLVIEEVSDISVYEDKKKHALNELDKVGVKLNDAHIILAERKTYLKELKKDRDQALKFKELKEKMHSNKKTMLDIQIKGLEKDEAVFDNKRSKLKDNITRINCSIEDIKKYIQSRKEEISKLNKEIEIKGEKEYTVMHKEIEDIKVGLATDKTRMSSAKDEISKIAQRKDQLIKDKEDINCRIADIRKEMKDISDKKDKLKKDLEMINKKISAFKKKNKLEDIGDVEKEIDSIDREVESLQTEINSKRLKQQEYFREKDRCEIEKESMDEMMHKMKEIEKEHRLQLKELKDKKDEFKKAALRLSSLLAQDSSLAVKIKKAREELILKEESFNRLKARNANMKEFSMGGIAVNKIIAMKKNTPGIFGTIASLGKADSRYSLALETAAGGRVNSIVVDKDTTAAECINYLKKGRFGVASFIPLNRIKTPKTDGRKKDILKSQGVHGFASDIISYDSRYDKAFKYVFGDTIIVDNINVARRIGIGNARMVTLDGDIAETSGVMRGGSREKRNRGLFKEKNIDDDLAKAESDISKIRTELYSLDTKREEGEKEITELRRKKHELEGEVIKLEKTLHIADTDLDASLNRKKELQKILNLTESNLSKIQSEIAVCNKRLGELKIRKQKLRSEIGKLKEPKLLAEISAFEESRRNYSEEISKIDSLISTKEMQIESMMLPEKEKIDSILKQHDKEEKRFKEDIKKLSEKIKKMEGSLKEKEKESAKFYSQYKGLYSSRDKISEDIMKKESKLESMRERVRANEIEENKISLRCATVKAKLAGLCEEIKNYSRAPLLRNKNIEDIRKEISRFEYMLEKMDAVNMKALDIYEEVEREYSRIVEKEAKLKKEKEDILSLIEEVEGKKREQFISTFERLNKRFQEIFKMISNKGNAYLDLEDKKSPLDGGVNIKVKITGRKYLDIKSLSGGEKTLTALSFIFAIQETNPATFYIFDEVDAALDKKNSEKLGKLIRNYSANAQYLVISHNDSVIGEGETLYGVSMNEFGISKITSLKV